MYTEQSPKADHTCNKDRYKIPAKATEDQRLSPLQKNLTPSALLKLTELIDT